MHPIHKKLKKLTLFFITPTGDQTPPPPPSARDLLFGPGHRHTREALGGTSIHSHLPGGPARRRGVRKVHWHGGRAAEAQHARLLPPRCDEVGRRREGEE